MRGEHSCRSWSAPEEVGIIPACAGSTDGNGRIGRLLMGSSPHARGAPPERAGRKRQWRDHPRMRGEHLEEGHLRALRVGIIPACAGSTARFKWSKASLQGSSPHARGAQRLANATERIDGDHPRMRGEHAVGDALRIMVRGIIPACAGSTFGSSIPAAWRKGSSPHARGAPLSGAVDGNHVEDHPRMRGEHYTGDAE